MEWLNELRLRVRALWRSRQLDRDLEDEMAFHLEMRERSLRDDGAAADAARAGARRQFGNTLIVKETMRELWRWGAIDRLWQDVRFGIRLAGRQRSFTAIVVATLALGIGSATAMFTIVDAVVLRPFSLPDPDSLVVMREINRERNLDFGGSAANYVDYEAGATAFAALGAFEMRNDNRTDGAEAERVNGAVASAPLFRALGIQPAAGRFFTDDEDRPANRFVAVLGHEYWRRRFNGDPGAVGRTLVINGEPHSIVGVMPPMRDPFVAELWRPLAADPAALDRGSRNVDVIGRLANGQTLAGAEAQLNVIADRLAAEYPRDNGGFRARLEPLYDAMVKPPTRRAMLVLMGSVSLLLLIACVNVANLMLARGTRRQREVATRLALGASRWRVARQLLVESGIICVIGGGAGLLVAVWSLQLAEWVYPAGIAGQAGLELNGAAVAAAAFLAAGTTLIVGVAPVLQLWRVGNGVNLASATRGVADASRGKSLRYALVVSEIALALVLLVGAGLLLRSVDRLRDEPLGFAPGGVVTARIGLYGQRYEESYAAYAGFVDGLVSGLEERPGIAAAGVSSSIPFGGGYTVMQVRDDGGRPELAAGLQAAWRVIGGNYLAAMGIPLKSGRAFAATDDRNREVRVTIINETLAQRVWPGENPIGRHLIVGDARRPYEVVGVTASSRMTMLGRDPEPAMYFHYLQFPWASLTLAIRTTGSPASLTRAIRATVAGLDREQPVAEIRPMTDLVDDAAAAPRMNASVLAIFAALALTLAAIGVYGVMSYSAAQRSGEIGVRLALGARPIAMFSLIWLHGLRLSALGLGLGLLGAVLLARALGALLYDVSMFDPLTYGAVFSIMLAVTVIACYVPARRAMRVEPSSVLRHE
jgi:putative ABC transport system permease protein